MSEQRDTEQPAPPPRPPDLKPDYDIVVPEIREGDEGPTRN